MATVPWPPPTPPNTRANATLQLDAHPLDHNRIADALDTLIARAGGLPTVMRFGSVAVNMASGSAVLNLPTPFPNNCAGAIVQISAGAIGPGNTLAVVAANPTSKSTVALIINNTGSFTLTCFFLAWGT